MQFSVPDNAVAVVGMAGRFPGANSIDALWANILNQRESIHQFSDEELLAAGIPHSTLLAKNYVKANGRLADYDKFDADFFGFTPAEATILDPQQRLLFEVAWTALEHAGYPPSATGVPTGVFAGVGANTYLLQNLLPNPSVGRTHGAFQLNVSSDKDFAATHLAYKLNLTGPAVSLQTACSTSLVAIHQAAQSLLAYQCDIALAGGSSITSPQETGYFFTEGGIASPDGHCRPFTAEANGTVRGSGTAMVVLKRLEEAIEDKDTIYATLLASAINNDGSDKVGFTAPSVRGQAEVIAMAQSLADIDPTTIGFIETHGTGTALGDPIEIEALISTYPEEFNPQSCALGAVKGNLGHLDAAAGVTGFIKATLALHHGIIPPNLHGGPSHEKIDFDATPFYLPESERPWPRQSTPRRAAVSSFGIGGTNAHAILEENTTTKKTFDSEPVATPQLFVISAKSDSALIQIRNDLAHHLKAHKELRLCDIAHTLQVGRAALPKRFFTVACDLDTLISALLLDAPSIIPDPPQEQPEPDALQTADRERALLDLGALWAWGKDIHWPYYPACETARRVALPTYPFARTRHWISAPHEPPVADSIPVTAPPESTLFYEPAWSIKDAQAQNLAAKNVWIIPSPSADIDAFRNHLIAKQWNIEVVPNIEALAGRLDIFSGQEAHLIICPDFSSPDATQVFVDQMSLAKLLGQKRPQEKSYVHWISHGGFSIRDEAIEHPKAALILGLATVLSQEMPQIQSRLIDLDQWDAEAILTEITDLTVNPDRLVCRRSGERYTRWFRPIESLQQGTAFKQNGTYWITGGFGGMGRAFTRMLIKEFGCIVYLTGRSDLSVEQAAVLEEMGGQAHYIKADVCSEAALSAAYEHIINHSDRLDGVIHAAGIAGGSILLNKSAEEAARVLAPKTTGTEILGRLIPRDSQTHLILCSSVSALQGAFGQADYCAANAYLDSWAESEKARGRKHVVSINWDGWTESGMAVRAGLDLARSGFRPIEPHHPLIQRSSADGEGTTTYAADLRPDIWLLDEHRFGDQRVLPGTAYLDLSLAAFKQTVGTTLPVSLSDFTLLQRCVIDGQSRRTLLTRLTAENEGFRITISSQAVNEKQSIDHAQGFVRNGSDKAAQQLDLDAIQSNTKDFLIPFSEAAQAGDRGPRWQSRRSFAHHVDEWFSEIQLDERYEADLQSFTLHPALLDVALGSTQKGDLFLPFSYGKVEIHNPLPSRFFSHVQRVESKTADMRNYRIMLIDCFGRVCITIDDYQTRRFKSEIPYPATAPIKTEQLVIKKPGLIESLSWESTTLNKPKAGEITLAVETAALNFKDVLKALGTLSTPGSVPQIGDECAGVIVAVGSEDSRYKPGDRVIAQVSPAFQRHVLVPESRILPCPANLPWSEAGSFSIAALTAWHALVNKGNLQPGDRVLIQAATGGVGLAAVHVARHLGAEILATAGSETKRQSLRDLDIEFVYDSRSTEFAEKILEDTDGEGVDVVLNSLAGEFIPAGLSVLRRYGRFLELGKRDILENKTLDMQPFDRSLSFIAANLEPDHPRFRETWHKVIDLRMSGALPALPVQSFPAEETADAFTFMARAQHIGKIVLAIGEAAARESGQTFGLSDAQGQKALQTAVDFCLPQVAVSTIDLGARISAQADAYASIRKAVSKGPKIRTAKAKTPRNPAEAQRAIAEIWRQLLGIQDINPEDNFFEIGGDSLMAVQALSLINEAFDANRAIADFFATPTIQGLTGLFAPAVSSDFSQPDQNVDDELTQSLSRAEKRKARRQRGR